MDDFNKLNQFGSNKNRSIDGFLNTKPLKNQSPTKPLITVDSGENNMPQNKSVNISNPRPSLIGMTVPTNYRSSNRPIAKATKKTKKPRSKARKIVIRTSIVLILLIIGFVGYITVNGLNAIDKVFHGNVFSDLTAPFESDILKNQNGRVNILLAGWQGKASDEGPLTDSIMVVSVNTKNDTAFILSIPRDLWVYVPGLHSYQKINAAADDIHFKKAGYPNGGMGELEFILNEQLHIPIDYEVLVDYQAFKDAVNAVGGITVNIQSPNPLGLYDPYAHLKLPNGVVHLDAQQALDLAIARGDGPGSYGFPLADFDRTEHQRQILLAIFKKATQLNFLDNPQKITNLFNSFGNNVSTNLSFKDILALVKIARKMSLNQIESFAFSYAKTDNHPHPILTNYYSRSTGEDAIIPVKGIGNYSALTQYYNQLTSNNPLVQESAPIVILNATNQPGLAGKVKKIMQQKGYHIAYIADARHQYSSSLIINQSGGGEPKTQSALQNLFKGVSMTNTVNYSGESSEANGYLASFVIVLGSNFNINSI